MNRLELYIRFPSGPAYRCHGVTSFVHTSTHLRLDYDDNDNEDDDDNNNNNKILSCEIALYLRFTSGPAYTCHGVMV